jgi:hypothetical protein
MRSRRQNFIRLLCSSLIVFATTPSVLLSPASAQSSDSADFDKVSEEIEPEVPVEKPVKETRDEVSLEKEYAERGVDWHSWAEKVAGAVWDPLIDDQAMIYCPSAVKWQITSDYHVHILSVKTPVPGGAKPLVAAIKALDGNPILAFPRGSGKTVVDRVSSVRKPVGMHPVRGPVQVYP